MGHLDGKVAIVTGATSGIGERIAEVFVDEGACVVARDGARQKGLALESRCGPSLSFVRTDVTDEASVKAMVDHAGDAVRAAGLPGEQTRGPARRW
jgi:NAD(P)-dependent dehydrogenase (short-subunit alcohol dehydrogenase family)